eukprot:gene7979-9374_t
MRRNTAAPVKPLMSYTPYYASSNCGGSVNGIGFGAVEFQCSLNFTGDLSFMTFNIYGTTQYNLTTSLHPYCKLDLSVTVSVMCDSPVHSETYTLNQCGYSQYAGSSYILKKAATFSKVVIPSNSVVYTSLAADCQTVQSYWYATNGTVLNDSRSPWGQTTYSCQSGKPYSRYCSPNGPCTTSQLVLDQCTPSAAFKISCA